MVLSVRATAAWAIAVSGIAVALVPATVTAQDIPTATPVLNLPDDVFVPTPIAFGGAVIEAGGSARTEYDSNIYAQASNAVDDLKFIFNPYVSIRQTSGTVQLEGRAEANFRQFLSNETENAVGGEVRTNIGWTPTVNDKLTLLSGWQHVIEDRGEPEGRMVTSIGPREIDVVDADLSYAHQGARVGFSVRGTAATYRYVDAIDDDRNLDSYAFIGRATYRLTPVLNGFAEGFVNKRDFRASLLSGEVDRDSNTYGGRGGVAIDPGGTLRGEIGAGVYRFEPKSSLLDSRTGLSAQVGLIFQPRARTAFTLDGFIGNVATYRSGAQSREDTRLRAGVQQELRHNIRWQASAIYRRSRYYGTGITEDTYGGAFEVEYLINRRLILAGIARYSNRNSTALQEEFERLRGGIELRFHY